MKKLVSVILVLVTLFCTAAVAEGIDLSVMTEEELKALIDEARLELVKYHPEAAEGTILYEDENITITYTGPLELDEYGYLYVPVIVENHSDKNLSVILQNVSCNGWAIYDGFFDVPANKKAKEQAYFMDAATDAELTTAEDVQDIEADLQYNDTDTYERVIDPIHVVWTF